MLKAILAMSTNRCIGKNNTLPRYYPEDLKRFKALTLDQTIIMGRKTFESLWRPLPRREHIVVSRTPQEISWATCTSDPQSLIAQAGHKDMWVIGGAEMFAFFLPSLQVIEMTIIKHDVDGDVFLPPFEDQFAEVTRDIHQEYDFVRYERVL